MTSLFSQMSDDQAALAGCGVALLASFTVMAVSYHVGRLVRRDAAHPAPELPVNVGVQSRPAAGTGSRRVERRAA
jgi:DNA-binding transcriptional LysR family regulator